MGYRDSMKSQCEWLDCNWILESPSELDVHHIDRDNQNNSESNLITLCAGHHRRAHARLREEMRRSKWNEIYRGMSEVDILLTLLRSESPLSTREIESRSGLSRQSISKAAKKLQDIGTVTYIIDDGGEGKPPSPAVVTLNRES